MADNPARFNSKDQFLEWRNSRPTALYLQFLEDQRSELMANWGRGVLMSLEAQCKAVFLLEQSNLDWDSVSKFYDPEGGDDEPSAA